MYWKSVVWNWEDCHFLHREDKTTGWTEESGRGGDSLDHIREKNASALKGWQDWCILSMGTSRIWQVFWVPYNHGMLFSEVFAGRFRLPKVFQPSPNGTLEVKVIELNTKTMMGQKVKTSFSAEVLDQPPWDIPMSVHELEHLFCIGNGIKITAGQFKGESSMLLLDEMEGNLTIWTILSHEDQPVSFPSSHSRFDLILFDYKISISVSCYLITSCLVTSNANARSIKIGDQVRVIPGLFKSSKGNITHIMSGLIFFQSDGVEVCCILPLIIKTQPSWFNSFLALNHIQKCCERYWICFSYHIWQSCEGVPGHIHISTTAPVMDRKYIELILYNEVYQQSVSLVFIFPLMQLADMGVDYCFSHRCTESAGSSRPIMGCERSMLTLAR